MTIAQIWVSQKGFEICSCAALDWK